MRKTSSELHNVLCIIRTKVITRGIFVFFLFCTVRKTFDEVSRLNMKSYEYLSDKILRKKENGLYKLVRKFFLKCSEGVFRLCENIRDETESLILCFTRANKTDCE